MRWGTGTNKWKQWKRSQELPVLETRIQLLAWKIFCKPRRESLWRLVYSFIPCSLIVSGHKQPILSPRPRERFYFIITLGPNKKVAENTNTLDSIFWYHPNEAQESWCPSGNFYCLFLNHTWILTRDHSRDHMGCQRMTSTIWTCRRVGFM